jgi:putative hydrolase of the HAD superfamily
MIDLSRIQAVFFDADDTLFEVRGSIGEHYAKQLKKHGHDITAEEIDRIIPQAWRRMTSTYDNREEGYVTDHSRDERVWNEFLQNVMHDVGISDPSQELFADIYDEFGKARSRQLLPHVEQVLETLSRSVTLGVLTNNDKRIHQLIPDLGIANHFQFIFCASDIGYKKPSREVFSRIKEHIQLEPHQILYIGDCPKNDIHGALSADWNALWIRRNITLFSESEPHTFPESVPSILCFSELLHSFGKP